MPTPTKGPRLGSGPAHEKLLIANLARALFTHGRIRTTLPKARRLRPQAERLITLAKRGDVASRRQVQTVLRDTTWRKPVLHTLFTEIAPRYANRPGGYTRILKMGPRPGDNAPMAIIELVDREGPVETEEEENGGRRRFGRRRRGTSPPEGANRAERRAAARGRLTTPEHVHEHGEGEAEAEAGEELPEIPTDEELDAEAEKPEAEKAGSESEAEGRAEGAESDDDEGGKDRPKDS